MKTIDCITTIDGFDESASEEDEGGGEMPEETVFGPRPAERNAMRLPGCKRNM